MAVGVVKVVKSSFFVYVRGCLSGASTTTSGGGNHEASEAIKEQSGLGPRNGVFSLPCRLSLEHCFGFREVNIEVGDVLQGELAGSKVQDETEVSESAAIESNNRGENPSVVPVLADFRFNWSHLDWRGAMQVSTKFLGAFVVLFVGFGGGGVQLRCFRLWGVLKSTT